MLRKFTTDEHRWTPDKKTIEALGYFESLEWYMQNYPCHIEPAIVRDEVFHCYGLL